MLSENSKSKLNLQIFDKSLKHAKIYKNEYFWIIFMYSYKLHNVKWCRTMFHIVGNYSYNNNVRRHLRMMNPTYNISCQ
jgi:hypothetical protein